MLMLNARIYKIFDENVDGNITSWNILKFKTLANKKIKNEKRPKMSFSITIEVGLREWMFDKMDVHPQFFWRGRWGVKSYLLSH